MPTIPEIPGVSQIDPALARKMQLDGVALIDVRKTSEHALGTPQGALPVPRMVLEASPEAYHPDAQLPLLLICGGGRRSLLTANALAAQGYTRLYSIAGGFDAWLAAGLPQQNRPDTDDDFMERYSRHLRLPQVGLAGQQTLGRSRVLVVGAGGLGSPAAFYLAAAGVGMLRLVDDDVVERSNLQRQILHTEARVGLSKVQSARSSLIALNPRTRIEAVEVRLDAGNVEALLADVDVVIDGSDNFSARYVLSDACVRLKKPLVYGAVHRFEGQVSVFDAGRRPGVCPCYRCLFSEPPDAADAPNCSEAGVLGVLPGVIGLLQATEALKLLLDIGEPLTGRLLHFDALAMRFRETRLNPEPACAVCAPGRRLEADTAILEVACADARREP